MLLIAMYQYQPGCISKGAYYRRDDAPFIKGQPGGSACRR